MKPRVAIGFGMGLLMGLFAGVMFALLFAPAKGEELRGQLGEQWAVQREKLTTGLGKGSAEAAGGFGGEGAGTGQGTEPVPEG